MSKTLDWSAAPTDRPWSAAGLHCLAAALQAASGMLTRLAWRLSAAAAVAAPQTVEFHPIYRDAGAPEGALYINGELVGTIVGVTRL